MRKANDQPVRPCRLDNSGARPSARRVRGGKRSRRDAAAAFAKADRRRAGRFSTRPEDHLIVVLQVGPRLAPWELDRRAPADDQLDQAGLSAVLRTRERAAADQVAGLDVAAVRGEVS